MAQKTAWNAAGLSETDINTYLAGEGGAWTSWTVTCSQSFPVALNVTRARFGRWGRKIEFYAFGTFAGNGANGAEIIFTLPVAASTSAYCPNSSGFIFDASANVAYVGSVYFNSTTTCGILASGATSGSLLGATVMTAAVIAGDGWSIAGSYEAAS